MMELDAFLAIPTQEVARIVRANGPKVCVFPINGTRRWFHLERPEPTGEDYVQAYLKSSGKRHIELYKLFFDHGIDTLLTPIIGPDILKRGGAYQPLLERGLRWFAVNEDFLAFYNAYGVRVRVYGDAEKYFAGSMYTSVLQAYEGLTQQTASHRHARLFFGICAHDEAERVAEIGAHFHHEHGRLPSKREIVEVYYGEYVEPVDIFIGFDRPSAFDMPLIATGKEDLYFTIAPSPYLDRKTLRLILYDHMVSRHVDDSAYEALSRENWRVLADFYARNRHRVLGLGRRHETGKFWYPLPQVELPPELKDDLREQDNKQADIAK